jgi:hypothetical protein
MELLLLGFALNQALGLTSNIRKGLKHKFYCIALFCNLVSIIFALTISNVLNELHESNLSNILSNAQNFIICGNILILEIWIVKYFSNGEVIQN